MCPNKQHGSQRYETEEPLLSDPQNPKSIQALPKCSRTSQDESSITKGGTASLPPQRWKTQSCVGCPSAPAPHWAKSHPWWPLRPLTQQEPLCHQIHTYFPEILPNVMSSLASLPGANFGRMRMRCQLSFRSFDSKACGSNCSVSAQRHLTSH